MSLIFIFLIVLVVQAFALETKFIYNGFQGSINNLTLDGFATVLPNGLLRMTFDDHREFVYNSNAFYPHPILFRPNHLSFSTTFVFAANSLDSYAFAYPDSTGIVFGITDSLEKGYFGWGPFPIHVFSVSVQKYSVEIYVKRDKYDSISLVASASASYYSDKEGVDKQLILSSGKPIQIWIEYDEVELLLNVTLAPFRHPKPSRSLLSKQLDLSTTLINANYIGFSYCTNNYHLNDRYILGWSWNQNGKAKELDPSKLPRLPRLEHKLRNRLLVLFAALVFLIMIVVTGLVFWKKKYNEFPEPWEKEFESQKFSYKDLCVATKGFGNSEVLGVGGFGKVYKGVLPSTNVHVAVKRISHNSKQGMKEFVAEITSMRRLSHRYLVKLLGYCRKNAELILVYEYMPNGSLDRFLFSQDKKLVLSWCLRFKIIKGVASALLYLHDEGKQVVLHRDIKASNVLLDADMNSRLSDFGLARFHDHNLDPRITHVVGTIGYIAPEMSRTRTPTTCSDVYAFGMFLLEVCCGRRPIDRHAQCDNDSECVLLSDWVYNSWKSGEICKVSDPRMGGNYEEKEIELVLKLGLLCLHPQAEKRPTMNKVVQFLDGGTTDDRMPDLLSDYDIESHSYFWEGWGKTQALPSSCGTVAAGVLSSTNSVLHYGR